MVPRPGLLLREALRVGRAAYNAGQDVQQAIQIAGGTLAVATTAASQIYGYLSQPILEPNSQSMSSEAAMGRRYPQGRNYGAYYKRARTAPVAKPVKRYVKKCMDRLVDDKYTDASISTSLTANTGNVQGPWLYGITQGLTDSSRIGNNIRIKRIAVKARVQGTNGTVRVIWLWDKQSNGALPAFGEVISNNTDYGPYNHDTVIGWGGSRFKVLSDRRYALNTGTLAVGGAALQASTSEFNFSWKGDQVVRFDTSTGAITDMVSGNLVLMLISDVTGNSFVGNITIHFNDA